MPPPIYACLLGLLAGASPPSSSSPSRRGSSLPSPMPSFFRRRASRFFLAPLSHKNAPVYDDDWTNGVFVLAFLFASCLLARSSPMQISTSGRPSLRSEWSRSSWRAPKLGHIRAPRPLGGRAHAVHRDDSSCCSTPAPCRETTPMLLVLMIESSTQLPCRSWSCASSGTSERRECSGAIRKSPPLARDRHLRTGTVLFLLGTSDNDATRRRAESESALLNDQGCI